MKRSSSTSAATTKPTPPGAAAPTNTIAWSTATATTWAPTHATAARNGRVSSAKPGHAGKNATPAPGSSSRILSGMPGTKRGVNKDEKLANQTNNQHSGGGAIGAGRAGVAHT